MRRAVAITDPEATWVPRLLADHERKLVELRREPNRSLTVAARVRFASRRLVRRTTDRAN